MEMHFKMTLYHKLAIAIKKKSKKVRGEAHSTKLKVTPEKTVSFLINSLSINSCNSEIAILVSYMPICPHYLLLLFQYVQQIVLNEFRVDKESGVGNCLDFRSIQIYAYVCNILSE